MQELSGTTPIANMLVGGIDEVFSRTDSAGARSFLTDGLGSTLALLDSAGAAQTSYTYDGFGNTTLGGAASSSAIQYTGRENDASTGLYYYRARYYSPALQRFVSEDPIGFAGGDVNLHAYVSNDPINSTDPSGLERLQPYHFGRPYPPPPPALSGRKDSGFGSGGGIPPLFMAGGIAVMDGPQPGPADAIALVYLAVVAVIVMAKASDPPDNVRPFRPRPKPIPVPPPPPGGSGRDGECFRIYSQCLLDNWDDAAKKELCRQAYLNCKNGMPTIFPGGSCVK